MHVTITDPESGEVLGTLCIDRGAGTCFILSGQIEVLDALVATAKASKAPEALLVLPLEALQEVEPYGWQVVPELVVLRKVD